MIVCLLKMIIPVYCEDDLSIWLENDCLKNMSKCSVHYNIIEDTPKAVVHLFDHIEEGDIGFSTLNL